MRSFLTTLARDTRANTLALVAIAIIPLAGMVGGGIDISRMYIVKTRLQHGCDAGALAGRKMMGGGRWVQTINGETESPRKTAERFFNSNFDRNAYGGTTPTYGFTENAGKVTGNASAQVPMTLMRIFGKTTQTMAVTCEADMRLPNTDVMFVLDVTGSMASKPDNTSCNSTCTASGGSKIQALRLAVKCFYEIVARLDTDATCDGGAPSGGTGNGAQVRFGFVPYSVNVNVGKLLPNDYFANSGTYQSREAMMYAPPQTTTNGPYWETYGSSISQSDCLNYMNNVAFSGFSPTATSSGAAPAATTTVVFNSDGNATSGGNGEWSWSGASDTSGTTRSCRRSRTDTTTTYFRTWNYAEKTIDFSALKAGGSTWNSSFVWKDGTNGANRTITWNGCVEERQTVKDAASYNPPPASAYDLDIDKVPDGGSATQWKPSLPQLVYLRQSSGAYTRSAVDSTSNFPQPSSVCPVESRKLQEWPNASDFDTYVNSLAPVGNTYHDIGMIWGARLMSPTGIFRAENEFTPKGGEIERHMIFFTDGIAQANPCDYSAYGVAWFDRRTTDTVGTAANCGSESLDLDAQINKRLEGLCTVVKNKNITLWVISFGAGVDQTTKNRLTSCASPSRFFDASDSAALQTTFRNIANQISALRLTS